MRRAYKRLSDEEKATILELYDDGLTFEAIANRIGCSIAPVWRYVKKERRES